ncbi:MAG TPA: phosphoenolpyruvate carboxykinase (ATP), partial [Gemmatimonadaceae bacterium]|nr:phosphoenolpyruvate carboxykinase (ATP) [Gemmatimonadaceae bacterium]
MATRTKPRAEADERRGQTGLEQQGLAPSGTIHWNLVAPELVQAAMRQGNADLADMGPLVAITTPHTGRSPNDKFIVKEAESEGDVWWGKVNRPF